jgi:multidrug resistance efflux pump
MDVARTSGRRSRRRAAFALVGFGLLSLVALGLVTVGLRELRPAAPGVDRATVWMDTVRRGPLVREVSGPGTLVPEEIRWLAAPSSAQVERVLERPGATVRADTVVVVLINPQLELAALEAERALSGAQAQLVDLEATLNAERLGQESVIATLKSELTDAVRRARADEELARKGFLSALEQGQTLERASELRGRLEFEQQRLAAVSQGMAARVAAQRAQIARLRAIAEFEREQVERLSVRAGVGGVLSQLSLEQGQSVVAGALLGKVVRPERLKATLRISETQAKDVQLGQVASIDTHNGVVLGHVVRIDPAALGGKVGVDVALEGALPSGARPDLNVQGTIELEHLDSVVFVGRPAVGQPGTTVGLFKLDEAEQFAERTTVALGRSSAQHVEVVSGLKEGDRVILSELSQWDEVDRIRLQ